MNPPLYAILLLENLAIKKFNDKDEWKNAVQTLTQNNKSHIALKWHAGAKQYVKPETFEL